MSVLAIIAALVIEQWRPLGDRKSLQGSLASWAAWLEQSFNGGERQHGIIAWLVAVLPAAGGALVVHELARALHPALALAFNVAVLYLTLGFRQFSHHFTALQLAVKSGDIEQARAELDAWRGASFAPESALASTSISSSPVKSRLPTSASHTTIEAA